MVQLLMALALGIVGQSSERQLLDMFPDHNDIIAYQSDGCWFIFWTESQHSDSEPSTSSNFGKSGGPKYCPSKLVYVRISPHKQPTVIESSWPYFLMAETDAPCSFFPQKNTICARIDVLHGCGENLIFAPTALTFSVLGGWEEALDQTPPVTSGENVKRTSWTRCFAKPFLPLQKKDGDDGTAKQIEFESGLSVSFRVVKGGQVEAKVVVTTPEKDSITYCIPR